MKDTFDAKDHALVDLLRVDARAPFAQLGAGVGLSADAVRVRIHRLLEAGTIKFATLIDPAVFGLTLRVNIGVEVLGPPDEFARWALEQDEILHLVRVLGPFTFFGEVVASSPEEAHSFISGALGGRLEVRRVECWPILGFEKWREDTHVFLPDDYSSDGTSALQEHEIDMLRELVVSPRIPVRDLAASVGRPYGVVRRRLADLFQAGVAKATVVTNEIELERRQPAVLLARAQDASALDALRNHKAVTIVSPTAGTRRIIAEVVADSMSHLRVITDELASAAPSLANVELLPYASVDKLPASLSIGHYLSRRSFPLPTSS
ncbi:AsnC family transcriptional regulator [Paenarthrobacter sp. NPDC057981]|uniref:AsnC family transcriptional regulator n=1 Tax=Paenarthrobacter sp. NPDC057981 TaxID=3346297 RepID=UPI0036DC2FBF